MSKSLRFKNDGDRNNPWFVLPDGTWLCGRNLCRVFRVPISSSAIWLQVFRKEPKSDGWKFRLIEKLFDDDSFEEYSEWYVRYGRHEFMLLTNIAVLIRESGIESGDTFYVKCWYEEPTV